MELATSPPPLPTTRPQATPANGSPRLKTALGFRRAPSRPDLRLTLGETEKMAASVAGAQGADPFAAAVLAYRWLGQVSDVQPYMFETDGDQRAWAEAWCVLDGAARSSKKDVRLQGEVASYLACKREADRFDQALGPDPSAHIQTTRGAVLQALRATAWWTVALACTLPPALFCLVAGVCLGLAGLALWIGAVMFAVPAGISAQRLLRCRTRAAAARAEAEKAERLADEQRSFRESARGGRFLSMVARRHPLLRKG